MAGRDKPFNSAELHFLWEANFFVVKGHGNKLNEQFKIARRKLN
jgi:hypothetical protein